ncbi:MAG: hypothetical protein JO246_10515 [Frankiaceae bacterium]|nr:hypothetical protein [Frankiaceae bacterium]MBV9872621.1 hypothetical protein [Frankiaceae bacterium]
MARTAAKKAPARRTTSAPARTPAAASSAASSVTDLAGGLQSLLGAVEGEVRAVTTLSTQIDSLVSDLNTLREEQAQRLLALDALRASAKDGGLTSFLDKLIRPRLPKVPEVIPDRLAR